MCPYAHLTCSFLVQAFIRLSVHQFEGGTHLLVGQYFQKWRLFQLDRECLLESAIEDRIASSVREIRQYDGVLLGEPLLSPRTPEQAACDQCGYQYRRRHQDLPTAKWRYLGDHRRWRW